MLKEMIKIENHTATDWVAQAVEVLSRGGVVAFPTETVYGLAVVPGVPGALEKLNRLKIRPAEKPYTLHIGSPDKFFNYVPNPPWPGRVLARKAWPGPLTLVVEMTEEQIRECRKKFGTLFDKLYHENSIGIRCPDHPVAISLLTNCDMPIVAPSANPADQPPALDARQVENYFGDQVDLILDAGPVKYRKASTVVKVNQCDYTVVREGIIDSRTVDRLAQFTILFVCSGNTCRSPMAQGLGRKILERLIHCPQEDFARLKINILSAGTGAGWSLPPSQSAVAAVGELGVDISEHRSQPVTAKLVNQADMIFVMSREHKEFICELVPGVGNRIKLLAEAGISDPIGGSDQNYRTCARNIEKHIEARLKELLE
ncbi:MAG: L-threonylcarbamoyladenylate synthase [Phycisphaerae bacterium]